MFFKNFTITDRMFCGGVPLFGGKGACQVNKNTFTSNLKIYIYSNISYFIQGDAGGPVIYNRVAVGLVTIGGYCGDPWKPSIFARISTVTGWIKGEAGIP